MAVETPQMNNLLSSSQLLINREMIKPNHHHHHNHNHHFLNDTQMDIGGAMPFSSSTMPESFLPFQQQSTILCHPYSTNKTESGLTYHHIPVPCRKRFRDSIIEEPNSVLLPIPQKKNKLSSQSQSQSPFLDQQLLYHFHTQQSDIDRLISQHTEKIRMELEEQRMRQSRMLLTAIQDVVVKKLKEKDLEIQRVGKLNWVLQERVKSLWVENQIWKEMAQTNEAAANSLRSNLEQVLAHVSNDDHHHHHIDDAESSCSSNNNGDGEEEVEGNDAAAIGIKMCSECGVRESVVLLIPCRHLCLCTVCGSTIRNCPLCLSGINASVHVNFA